MASVEEECLNAFNCANGGKYKVLKLLPKLRNPESVRDNSHLGWKGCTLVHRAARRDWDDVCKLLVEQYNCDPTTESDRLVSPLHTACDYGSVASIKYLLSLPSVLRRINDKSVDGNTPLHCACLNDNLATTEILLNTNSVNITEKNNEGLTPIEMLHRYSYNQFAQFVKIIDWSTQFMVKSSFNVFLVGNTAAGKSTLAAAMLELTRDAPTQHGRISNVKELTAGVIPTQCEG